MIDNAGTVGFLVIRKVNEGPGQRFRERDEGRDVEAGNGMEGNGQDAAIRPSRG